MNRKEAKRFGKLFQNEALNPPQHNSGIHAAYSGVKTALHRVQFDRLSGRDQAGGHCNVERSGAAGRGLGAAEHRRRFGFRQKPS